MRQLQPHAWQRAEADLHVFATAVTSFSAIGSRISGEFRNILEAAIVAAFVYCLLIHSLCF
jgi:hypothetical protein